MSKCTKPNCDCLERARKENGGPLKYGYQCLYNTDAVEEAAKKKFRPPPSTPPLTEEREGNDQIHIVLADGVTARVSPNASPQLIEALTKMVDLTKVGFPSPQIECDSWLNIDMPEYLKDGRDKGRFAWEQGYKAAAARYRNPPSSPTQTEERGEVPEDVMEWIMDNERRIWELTAGDGDHPSNWKTGAIAMYHKIQSQLSEARNAENALNNK